MTNLEKVRACRAAEREAAAKSGQAHNLAAACWDAYELAVQRTNVARIALELERQAAR